MEQKTGPKDVFLHLLSIIALYVSVGTLISLVFQYINVLIPDPLQVGYYYISNAYGSIRWLISILIIVFPVYCWTVWYLDKGYDAVPARRESRLRKWLIYLTLFLATLLIIGDLISLVYKLLGGEFTSRFILKVFTVLLIAGAVFAYYLSEIKRGANDKMATYVQAVKYISVVAVVAAIITGFFIVGSPTEERAYRFDDQRVQNLQQIQSQILSYWQSKNALPDNLSQLHDQFSGFSVPKDPESGSDFVYRKTGNLTFELCANFNRPNRTGTTKEAPYADPYYSQEDWRHETGEHCFSRTIDPERYSIDKPLPVR